MVKALSQPGADLECLDKVLEQPGDVREHLKHRKHCSESGADNLLVDRVRIKGRPIGPGRQRRRNQCRSEAGN